MRISVRNQQQILRPHVAQIKAVLRTLAQMAQRWRPPATPWRELGLVLLDDEGMAAVNQVVMGHAGTTDVITQSYTALPGEPPGLVGEVFVNVAIACRATRRGNWDHEREFALYLAHACDHLAGGTDATPESSRQMRRRELAWLRKLELPPLFK